MQFLNPLSQRSQNQIQSPFQPRFQASNIKTTPPIQTIQPDLFAPRKSIQGLKRFVVMGDAGSGTENQMKIAKQMAEQYAKNPFASVLVLGDNVYEDGEPHLFEERIYKPYEKLFEEGVRFYPVLGNHDVRKDYGDQQLAYWGAPSFYNFKIGNDVEFFALDTTVFLPGYDKCYDNNKNLALKKAEVQALWLDKVLSESKSRFKVVYGHYPIYSSGKHSTHTDSLMKLRGMLEPIFTKYGVDLYLAGHEHHYERSKVIQGIVHIVSGAAGRLREIFHTDTPPHPREKAIQKFQFMVFDITPEGLKYEAISKKGKILDSGILKEKQRLAQFA